MNFNFDLNFKKPLIGVDEVGKGSWAGPVLAGAAFLDFKKPLHRYLDDSKKLTSKKRNEVLQELSKNHLFGIGAVSNSEIDKYGIMKATFKAMEEAVNDILKKIYHTKISLILVDGTVMPEFDKQFSHDIKLIKKGDTISPSIAAASIFAKCSRDKIMEDLDEIYPGYNFFFNKGYGTIKHKEKLFISGPTQIHRMSFSPMQNL